MEQLICALVRQRIGQEFDTEIAMDAPPLHQPTQVSTLDAVHAIGGALREAG